MALRGEGEGMCTLTAEGRRCGFEGRGGGDVHFEGRREEMWL